MGADQSLLEALMARICNGISINHLHHDRGELIESGTKHNSFSALVIVEGEEMNRRTLEKECMKREKYRPNGKE